MAIGIRLASGNNALGTYSVGTQPVCIGRSSSCDIRIPSTLSEISSKHIILKESAGALYIMDGDGAKASTNGVYLNGFRISPNKWINTPIQGVIILGDPNRPNCVQITVGEQAQPVQSVSAGNQRSIPSTAPVPIQLTNPNVNVSFVRPTRTRGHWQTPANLLLHAIGLGICIAVMPAVTGSAWGAGIVIVVIIIFEIYFLPSIISFNRDQPNRFAIFALNLFLGWTLLGWVVSLVWSLTAR